MAELPCSEASMTGMQHKRTAAPTCCAITCTCAAGCSTLAAASVSRPNSGVTAQRAADCAATRRWRPAAAARRRSRSACSDAATAAITPASGSYGRLSCSSKSATSSHSTHDAGCKRHSL